MKEKTFIFTQKHNGAENDEEDTNRGLNRKLAFCFSLLPFEMTKTEGVMRDSWLEAQISEHIHFHLVDSNCEETNEKARECENRRRLHDFSWCGRQKNKREKLFPCFTSESEGWTNSAVEFYALQWAVTRLEKRLFSSSTRHNVVHVKKSFSFPYST